VCYTVVQTPTADAAAAISTEPTPTGSDNTASDEPQRVALTLSSRSKVIDVHRRFNGEQIDCICDVLRQSNDVELLHRFLGQLTADQLHRDSEPLYKVRQVHSVTSAQTFFVCFTISIRSDPVI